MRILLLIYSMGAGGAERVASTLVNAWAERGDSVTLMTTFMGCDESFYPLLPEVQFIRMTNLASTQKPKVVNQIARFIALRRFIVKEKPDVIISFLTHVNVVSVLATIGLRTPIIVCEHNDPFAMPSPLWLRLASRLTYPLADVLTVLTPNVVTKYSESGWNLKRIRVMPNPVSDQMIHAQHLYHVKDKRYLLSIGRFVDQKQFTALIRVFAGIADRYKNWNLRILGEGPLRLEMEKQINELGLKERVELPGTTTAIIQEMINADIFTLTSKHEGFPMTMLEAMTIGLPCAVYDCPSGPREISMDGQIALLVPHNDEKAMKLALEQLMTDEKLRQSLGTKARKSVIERFSMNKILELWDALFAEIGTKS